MDSNKGENVRKRRLTTRELALVQRIIKGSVITAELGKEDARPEVTEKKSERKARIGLKLLEQLYEQGEDAKTIIKQKVIPLLHATKRSHFAYQGKMHEIEVPDHKVRLKGVEIALRLHGLYDKK